MFTEAYKQAFNVLKSKPFRLWGLSLLNIVICAAAGLLSIGFLPLGMAFAFVIDCGMAKVYLDGLSGREVNADQLFEGCKSFGGFLRIAGGMAWQSLWIFLWCLIPIVGPVFAVIKYYEYRFVPYILMTRPEVSATQALRLSMQLTKGKKGQMFLADFLLGIVCFAAVLVLTLFAFIPIIGLLFGMTEFLLILVLAAFSPVFIGLYGAAFYRMPQVIQQPQQPQPPTQMPAPGENA